MKREISPTHLARLERNAKQAIESEQAMEEYRAAEAAARERMVRLREARLAQQPAQVQRPKR